MSHVEYKFSSLCSGQLSFLYRLCLTSWGQTYGPHVLPSILRNLSDKLLSSPLTALTKSNSLRQTRIQATPDRLRSPGFDPVNFTLSPLFQPVPAALPVVLYQETLVDQIKQPAQHTLIFPTTLARLPSYFISLPQISLLYSFFPLLFSCHVYFPPNHTHFLVLKWTFQSAHLTILQFWVVFFFFVLHDVP